MEAVESRFRFHVVQTVTFFRVPEEKAEGLVVVAKHSVCLGHLCGRAGVAHGGHDPVRLSSFAHPSEDDGDVRAADRPTSQNVHFFIERKRLVIPPQRLVYVRQPAISIGTAGLQFDRLIQMRNCLVELAGTIQDPAER